MKKKLIGMLLLLVLCTGCTIANAELETHEAGYNLITGSYFDISDLIRNGSFQQYITVGYEGVTN